MSTTFAISGMAAATAFATCASSPLMIFKIRSVGKRSISTERGLRRSGFMNDRDLLVMLHALLFYFGAMKEVDVQIRRALGIEDYQKVIELEKQVWGYTDAADLAAVPLLMIANGFGG